MITVFLVGIATARGALWAAARYCAYLEGLRRAEELSVPEVRSVERVTCAFYKINGVDPISSMVEEMERIRAGSEDPTPALRAAYKAVKLRV